MRTGGVPPGILGEVYRINRLRHWDFLQHGRVRILTRAANDRFAKQRAALADLGYFYVRYFFSFHILNDGLPSR